MWDRIRYASIVPPVAVREAVIALRPVVLALCLAVAAGCGSGSSPEVGDGPDGTPEPVLVAGRAVFIDRCASCHDDDGSGTGNGPRLNRGRLAQAYPDPDDATAIVLMGRNRMPAFGGQLTGGEIDAVLRYIGEILQ